MLPITIVPAVTDRPRQLLARRLTREPAPADDAETECVTASATTARGSTPEGRRQLDAPEASPID